MDNFDFIPYVHNAQIKRYKIYMTKTYSIHHKTQFIEPTSTRLPNLLMVTYTQNKKVFFLQSEQYRLLKATSCAGLMITSHNMPRTAYPWLTSQHFLQQPFPMDQSIFAALPQDSETLPLEELNPTPLKHSVQCG
jgi:hypothetical protein